jgi:integrase
MPHAPEIPTGPHCTNPVTCEFFDRCNSPLPDHHIGYLPRLHASAAEELEEMGVESILDIPADFPLSERQRRAATSVQMGEPWFSTELGKELECLKYPLYFMDFESINPAIPRFSGMRPFDQLPFQWSVHVQSQPDAKLEHYEFLSTDGNKEEYGWTTVSKIRGIMNRIFKIGIIHKKVTKNPVEGLRTSVKTTYKAIKITPAQTLLILRSVMGNMLHFTLVFVVAATALRSSEVLSLRWADILWEERKIRVVKSWKKTGVDGSTKTPSSERDVPMGRVLAHYLHEWHKQTPYAKPTDFVFPSMNRSGRVPICSSVFCSDYLRPAAKAAGVAIPDGHRWGLHNLRHSLSNWLVNKAKENPKTVQGILGHSRIQTTLDLYTDEDLDEMIAAQDKFLDAVGFERETVQ